MSLQGTKPFELEYEYNPLVDYFFHREVAKKAQGSQCIN